MLLALALAISTQVEPPPAEASEPPAGSGEIIVQGSGDGPDPLPDAATYFERHCFDRMRLRQSHKLIDDDYDWQLLPKHLRTQWDVASDVPAYILRYPQSDRALVIKFESFPSGNGLFDQVCTMVVAGGDDHRNLRAGLSKMMRGGPATNHIGVIDDFDTIPGWDQFIWTGVLARKSEQWKLFRDARGGPTFLVVVDPMYYRRNDYLILDLKTREEGEEPLSVARLFHRSRDRPETPLAAPSRSR